MLPDSSHSTSPLSADRPAPFRDGPPRSLARSAFHLVLGQGATTVLAVLLTGAIGRALGPADFGSWYVLTTTTGFAYVFVDWGYSAYVIGEIAKRPNRAGELAGTLLALRALTAVLVCIPALLSAWLLGHGPRMCELIVLNIAASMPMYLLTSFTWALRARERMDLDAVASVVLKLLMVVVTFLALVADFGLPGVILSQGVAGGLAFAVAWGLYKRAGLNRLRANLATARELVHGAAPMFTLGLMVSVHLYIDASLLAKLVPADVVGWYGATAVFSGTLLAPAVILASTVYPRLARAADDREAFARLVRGALRPVLFLSMLMAVGTFAFADFAIATVYHKDNFAPAASILRLFSVNLLLVSIDVLLGNVILASGGVRRFARAKAVAVVCSVGLELLLVPWCQRRFGNGGIGVVLSFAAGEMFLIAAALRTIPAGVIDRATFLDGGRAAVAGLGALLAAWLASPLSPLVAIPITIAAHTAGSFALGLVTRADLQCVLGLVASDKRGPLARVPARAA